MSTALVAAVNAAAKEMRATFSKIVSKSLTKIPPLLQDEVRRLAAVKDVQTESLAIDILKAMVEDGYKLRDAALLGAKPKATRFLMRSPMQPRHVIEDRAVRGDIIAAWQSLVTPAEIAGASLDVSAAVRSALKPE